MKNNDRRFKRITATGLVPLLLLGGLLGCVARHMPDWSEVQDVVPNTKTEIRLYEDLPFYDLPEGRRKIEGRFASANSDSITVRLKSGKTRTFQRKIVRKVLARRPLAKRWLGWTALITPFLIYGIVTGIDRTSGEDNLIGAPIVLSLSSIPLFYFADMGGIYEVPPEHRDWHPQETSLPVSDPKKPTNEK